jgi:multiple sugar transport system ATP-binding protein
MGNRVAVLDAGRLQQVDTPQRVYDAPANLFVATFIGSPAMNLYDGQVVARDTGGVGLELGAQVVPVDESLAASHPSLADRVGQRVVVGIRPEALDDAGLEPGVPGDRVIEATVDLVESLGAELVVHGVLSGVPERSEVLPALHTLARDREHVDGATDPRAAAPRAITVRLGVRSRVRPGDIVKLTVDPNGLHVFDADTGASLRAAA